MQRQCYLCRKSFKDGRGSMNLADIDVLFCSIECLLSFVKRQSHWSKEECYHFEKLIFPTLRPISNDPGRPPVFSTVTGITYKSQLERWFAERCHEAGLVLQYEGYRIQIDNKRMYTPDFYNQQHGIFFEPKGEWLGAGKKKFKRAVEIFGEERMLLVPYYLFELDGHS